MKHIVVLIDGAADWPDEALENKTALEYANLDNINQIAPYSEIGLVNTIPKGCAKGSDTANLSVLGYDPKRYYFGRSPLEALSMGVELSESDVTYRVNLVTLSDEEEYEQKTIIDHSADEITSEEAYVLIEALKESFQTKYTKLFAGVSYRHLLVWNEGSPDITLIPPHDILGSKIGDYKPVGTHDKVIWEMMKESYDLLTNHPINEQRRKRGLRPANSIWIWGEGTKPELPNFNEKYRVKGAMISAVDLLKGIAIGANMKSIDVEGATGTLHTNYEGKLEAAYKWLVEEDNDFVYIHLEGPDECGHRGETFNKIKALELIDQKIIGKLTKRLNEENIPFKLMVLPDHPTPTKLKTHTADPVPYLIYSSLEDEVKDQRAIYNENYAKQTDNYIAKGHELMGRFIGENIERCVQGGAKC